MSSILGISFSNKTMKETIEFLDNYMDNETVPFHVVTANPEIVMNAKRDRKFRLILKEANLITPDGIGIVIGSKILKKDIKERVAGYDMIHALWKLREENKKKTRVFMVGAKEDIVELAAKKASELYPHIEIVGFHHGYFQADSEIEKQVVKKIKDSKPDLVLAGFGSPRQEVFISTYKNEINAKVYIGCGGTFDVLSGKVERAPELFQKLYLEWLWRVIKDPKRLKRQLDIPRFLIEVIKEKRKK